MRKKITIIATCSLAAITVIASAYLMKKDSNNTTNKKQVAAEQQTEQETAVIGITNITSVGATLDVTGENLTAGLDGQATGQVSLYNTGFASTVGTYNAGITEEEKHNLIKDLDLVTEVVPEGSIIDGYTNLGISNVTSYLNVRKGAGTNYKIVGKMPGYSVCEIISDVNGTRLSRDL